MNEMEIGERLILAAEIESAAHRGKVGPKRDQSLNLGYVHDWADKNGWGKERLKEDEIEFQESVAKRPTPQQISEAEEAWGWLSLVQNEDNRAALAAWAGCMADNKRRFFKDWCRKTGIAEQTGRNRKDRAITRICERLARSGSQNNDNGSDGVLPHDPEIDHIPDTVDAYAHEASGRNAPYSLKQNDPTADDFQWAEKRNEHRRRLAKRRQQSARRRQAA